MVMFVRTLLIWLVILAVPAQAAAAVTMAFCGPNHQPGAVHQVATANAEHHHDAHQAEGAGVHQHSGLHDGGVVTAGSDHTVSTDFLHADTQKCSACASCCSGCALLGAQVVIGTPEHAGGFIAAPLIRFARVAVDGPERPPRASRA